MSGESARDATPVPMTSDAPIAYSELIGLVEALVRAEADARTAWLQPAGPGAEAAKA